MSKYRLTLWTELDFNPLDAHPTVTLEVLLALMAVRDTKVSIDEVPIGHERLGR